MRFVVQQHDASTLHYDFRLEVDGVLRSWAVPKGPSMNPADKRLAVEVEDHSIGWGEFEGRIRAGYGKGAVIVWDRGTYEPIGEVGMAEALDRGRASFRLEGEKLRGGFTLLRTHEGAKPKWLLFKRRDEEADGVGPVADRPESVKSGRTIEQL
jgi:DNA ligase D-like protein (predicted 3'-phosphoesterase)